MRLRKKKREGSNFGLAGLLVSDDNLDTSLAASLVSVSAALSGLARRIQEDKRNCSCSPGCDNEEEFGRSIATLVRNLPLNRRMGVKARILAVLASETASAAQEGNPEERHNSNPNAKWYVKQNKLFTFLRDYCLFFAPVIFKITGDSRPRNCVVTFVWLKSHWSNFFETKLDWQPCDRVAWWIWMACPQ